MAKQTSNGTAESFDLDTMSIADIEGILSSRKKQLNKLLRRREKLQAEIEQIDEQIDDIHGSVGAATGGGSRPRNSQNLPDTLEAVMKKHASGSKGMKVPQIVEAAEKSGYASSSKNFRGIVNQTLIKDDRFKQVSRGVYALSK